ncbi:MAG: hypothetical protein K6L73_11195 [Cellvibrionaceae bacterium]
MSEERFSIVFRGDLEAGHSLLDVKSRLAKLFKADEARVTKLFSGQPVVLKGNLDSATAEKYRQVLTDAGAHVIVKSEDAPATDSAEEKKRKLMEKRAEKLAAKRAAVESVEQSVEQSAPVAPLSKPKQTMAERLQAQEAGASSGANIFTQSESERVEAKRTSPDESGLALMPVGEDVLTEAERDDARPEAAQVTDLTVDLAPEGADILQESERETVAPVTVDVSGIDVAPQEGNLVSSDELEHEVPVQVDVPDFDIAEVGVAMDQAEKTPPPPPPDTSRISLS